MKKTLTILTVALAMGAWVGTATAADCMLHVKRIACAGKDAESYKKCDGKPECTEAKDAATTEDACLAEAKKSCDNSRTDITKYKSVMPMFKGKALVGGFDANGKADPKGGNVCDAARPDMNKCQ
ncbi:MAG: hypothetical protein H7840_08285 [Alphaproteobacteria bacterium]